MNFNQVLGNVAASATFLLLLGQPNPVFGEDWRQFRGENAAGVYRGDVPSRWGDELNLKWVIPLPGKGVSSPVVVGDRVYVTSFSGFGQDVDNPGEIANLRRHLVCVDRRSGKVLWQRSPPTRFPEDKFEGFITDHGYASCTPVSDGERVFVFFGKVRSLCIRSRTATPLWQQFKLAANPARPNGECGASPSILQEPAAGECLR